MDVDLEALELLPQEETRRTRGQTCEDFWGPVKTLVDGGLGGC